ncbi:hypothetical protein K4K57_000510 [Colletotrichum sp. SAR 10_99]|nr:hypothetical protein K4K57_000510 [Colletotrichum sp. SAR 10_99]
MKSQLSALVSLGAFLAVEAGVAGVSQSQSLSARDGVDLAVRSAAAIMTWADLESGADAAAICGSLGVFELPEGSDPALMLVSHDLQNVDSKTKPCEHRLVSSNSSAAEDGTFQT